MRELEANTLMFFDQHMDALPLYQAFEELLFNSFPLVNKRVQKTQITFSNRHVFSCISFARVKKKAELPEGYMVITLGLHGPLDSERVAVKTEPYPGRWTHHFVVSKLEELDEEMLSWIKDAYDFADAKGKKQRNNDQRCIYLALEPSETVSYKVSGEFRELFLTAFKIPVYDNWQYVKENILPKYTQFEGRRVVFDVLYHFEEEYLRDFQKILSAVEDNADSEEVLSL